MKPDWYLPVASLAYVGILLGLVQTAVACAVAIGGALTFDQWIAMAGGGQVSVLLGAGVWKLLEWELEDG